MEELAKFAALGWVVMLGFAMSFRALSNQGESFGETCLYLFKGMLGDVGFFDEFSGGGDHDAVATALFCVFLVVMAVMFLNLLIAVLGTSHSKVERKVDQEFKVSKALLIDRYRLVVDEHLLPPPFNLLQVAFAAVSFVLSGRGKWRRTVNLRAKQAVGRLAFWLVLGPFAVVAGTLLWTVSAVYAPFAWHRHYRGICKDAGAELLSGSALVLRYVVILTWCLVGAPTLLSAFWLTAPLKWLGREPCGWLWERRYALPVKRRLKPMTASEMLLTRPGVGLVTRDIQAHREDPMGEAEVREDEKTKNATMEHLKLLRNHIDKRLDAMEREQGKRIDRAEGELAVVEGDLRAGLNRAGQQVGDAHSLRRVDRELADLKARFGNVEQKLDKLCESVGLLDLNITNLSGTSD